MLKVQFCSKIKLPKISIIEQVHIYKNINLCGPHSRYCGEYTNNLFLNRRNTGKIQLAQLRKKVHRYFREHKNKSFCSVKLISVKYLLGNPQNLWKREEKGNVQNFIFLSWLYCSWSSIAHFPRTLNLYSCSICLITSLPPPTTTFKLSRVVKHMLF